MPIVFSLRLKSRWRRWALTWVGPGPPSKSRFWEGMFATESSRVPGTEQAPHPPRRPALRRARRACGGTAAGPLAQGEAGSLGTRGAGPRGVRLRLQPLYCENLGKVPVAAPLVTKSLLNSSTTKSKTFAPVLLYKTIYTNRV